MGKNLNSVDALLSLYIVIYLHKLLMRNKLNYEIRKRVGNEFRMFRMMRMSHVEKVIFTFNV